MKGELRVKYVLDRFEGDTAVFLKQPGEEETLLIKRLDIDIPLKEGDIVQITSKGERYKIDFLAGETRAKRERIKKLMEQLRRK